MAERLKMEIVESGDGSHTIKVPELKEHYHSHKGALRESLHVFIEMGLRQLTQPSVRVLEVGFGTGLNAMLTHLESTASIAYHSLEPFPLPESMWSQLNYAELHPDPKARELFESLHRAAWNEEQIIAPNFTLLKHRQTLDEFATDQAFDLVYYDAFAPHAQPELWTPNVWKKLFHAMRDGGILVTYCAKAQVRRDMIAAGFEVERLPGPPGKREMIRATKGAKNG